MWLVPHHMEFWKKNVLYDGLFNLETKLKSPRKIVRFVYLEKTITDDTIIFIRSILNRPVCSLSGQIIDLPYIGLLDMQINVAVQVDRWCVINSIGKVLQKLHYKILSHHINAIKTAHIFFTIIRAIRTMQALPILVRDTKRCTLHLTGFDCIDMLSGCVSPLRYRVSQFVWTINCVSSSFRNTNATVSNKLTVMDTNLAHSREMNNQNIMMETEIHLLTKSIWLFSR